MTDDVIEDKGGVADDDVTVNHNETDVEDANLEAPKPGEADNTESDKTDDKSEPEDKGESGKASDDEKSDEQEGISKKALKRRIYKESQERKRLEEELEELRKKTEESKPESLEPKREDFESLEEYFDARENFVRDETRKETEARIAQERDEESGKQEHEKLLRGWETQKEEARGKYDDFDEMMELSESPVTSMMASFMMESEIGADMSYYLASHVDQAKSISALSPIGQAKALAKLEDTVQAEVEKSNKKPVSGAPEPTPALKGGDADDDSPSAKDDTKAWIEKRRKQKAARRK